MPHHPKPFFKAKRNAWYVEVKRHQVNLGPHPDGLPLPKKRRGRWDPPGEILERYHRIMAEEPEVTHCSDTPPAVASLLDDFVGLFATPDALAGLIGVNFHGDHGTLLSMGTRLRPKPIRL